MTDLKIYLVFGVFLFLCLAIATSGFALEAVKNMHGLTSGQLFDQFGQAEPTVIMLFGALLVWVGGLFRKNLDSA